MKFLKTLEKGIFLSICLSFLLVISIKAQTFNGGGFTITDGGGRVLASCSTVAVSGITTSVNVSSISLNSINHTWIGDTETRVYLPGAAVPPSVTNSFVLSSPPDARNCNYAGTYRYADTATQSIDAATVGCTSAQNVTPGNYRASTYGGGTAVGPVISLATTFGTLTPAQANGNWLVCVFDFATPDGGTVGSTSIQFASPTAAGVSVAGRVLRSDGNGLGRVTVAVTDNAGNRQTVLTNAFGYYRFDELEVGQTYTVTVSSKTHQFENSSRVISLSEDIDNADFTALPAQ